LSIFEWFSTADNEQFYLFFTISLNRLPLPMNLPDKKMTTLHKRNRRRINSKRLLPSLKSIGKKTIRKEEEENRTPQRMK